MNESRYAWGPALSAVFIGFRVGGEELLPVALASMASKYSTSEAAMLAFNWFWLQRLPELRPTARLPGRREAHSKMKSFRAPAKQELGISDRVLWPRDDPRGTARGLY